MTLYIDVYFLINFTVDIISLYFAAIFSKVPTSTRRLIFSGIIGALSAILIVLMPETIILKLLASAISLFLMGYIATRPVNIKRKAKFVFSFIVMEALFGGVVSFIWSMLDRSLSEYFSDVQGTAVNRRMLFFSIIVLLSI